MLAAKVVGERAAEEVCDVGHRRAPPNGLPVHHRQRAVGAGLAEKHVVQPVVAVHQSLRAITSRLGGQVAVEAADQTLAHQPVVGVDPIAVAVDECGIQLADQRLIHRRLAVQPGRLRHRVVAK